MLFRSVSASDLVLPAPTESSADIRARVAGARRMQRERLVAHGVGGVGTKGPLTNADCSGQLLEQIAMPDDIGLALLWQAADTLKLSARGFHRTLKVARTIADLDGEERVGRVHVAEALSYRRETLSRAQAA